MHLTRAFCVPRLSSKCGLLQSPRAPEFERSRYQTWPFFGCSVLASMGLSLKSCRSLHTNPMGTRSVPPWIYHVWSIGSDPARRRRTPSRRYTSMADPSCGMHRISVCLHRTRIVKDCKDQRCRYVLAADNGELHANGTVCGHLTFTLRCLQVSHLLVCVIVVSLYCPLQLGVQR
jgi:hypothetical protein